MYLNRFQHREDEDKWIIFTVSGFYWDAETLLYGSKATCSQQATQPLVALLCSLLHFILRYCTDSETSSGRKPCSDRSPCPPLPCTSPPSRTTPEQILSDDTVTFTEQGCCVWTLRPGDAVREEPETLPFKSRWDLSGSLAGNPLQSAVILPATEDQIYRENMICNINMKEH